MYSGGCIYVKISVFLVKNNGEREREREKERELNLYLHTCVCLQVCVSSGMFKSFNLLVNQDHCFFVNVFQCV